MLWIKAFHIIFVVTWFSGLFYLPRLFVYHVAAKDQVSNDRFKVMERKLFFGITLPSAFLATLSGILLLSQSFRGYLQLGWMHLKLGLVVLLWVYLIICWKYVQNFKRDQNKHSSLFYRFFNEIPVLFLVGIVILVVVKPKLYF